MNIDFIENNGFLIAVPEGEIDHHSASFLKERIDREISAKKTKKLVFDFKNVNFMDSSGIGMIIGRYKALDSAGGKVYAVNINSDLKRIFEVSGLKKIIGCYESLSDLLKRG